MDVGVTIGARMSEHKNRAHAGGSPGMKCADVALLAKARRRDLQQEHVGRAVGIVTVAAVLHDRRMRP